MIDPEASKLPLPFYVLLLIVLVLLFTCCTFFFLSFFLFKSSCGLMFFAELILRKDVLTNDSPLSWSFFPKVFLTQSDILKPC